MNLIRVLPLSLSLLVLGACTASAQNRTEASMFGVQSVRSILVNGTGEAKAPSDEAFLDIAVETEGKTAKAAGEANAKLMETVRAALLAAGLKPADLETGRYSVYPEYSGYGGQNPSKPTIQGYRATNQLTVHTKQLDQLGAFIDKALGAGANRVENARFGLSNPEEAQGRALQDAVKRARRSAEVIAASLGVKLGEILEAKTVAEPLPPVPMMMKASRAMDSAETPITPGEQTVEARVELRFAIGK